MKLLLFLSLLSFNCFAEDSLEAPLTDWHFETNIAAQSIRTGKSPLVGPSALYSFNGKLSAGARALTSLSGTENESAASFQLLQRYNLNKSKTSLFVELDEAYNQINRNQYFASIGSSIGLTYEVTKFISVGGLSGLELDLEKGELYPKVLSFIGIKL